MYIYMYYVLVYYIYIYLFIYLYIYIYTDEFTLRLIGSFGGVFFSKETNTCKTQKQRHQSNNKTTSKQRPSKHKAIAIKQH